MRRFVVKVSEPAFERLSESATQDRRAVQEQAGWLLERQLLMSPQRSPVSAPGDDRQPAEAR